MRLCVLSSIESLSTVKVVALPVGTVPPEKYTALLQEIRDVAQEIEYASLTPPTVKDSSFKGLSWKASSSSKFHMEVIDGSTQTYNDAMGDDLHPHKRITAVLCICYCPASPNIETLHQKFLQLKQEVSTACGGAALRFKCYAFEPLENQADSLDRQDMIMFPNQDIKRLRFYLTTCLNDLASMLIEDFEHRARNMDAKPCPKAQIEAEIDSKTQRKLKAARQVKLVGDYCLLVGSPQDALTRYRSVMEALRLNADWLWLGSALEGQAAALVAEVENEGGGFSERVEQLYEQMFEAYDKVPFTFSLCLEATFRLIRYLIKYRKVDQVSQLLMRATQWLKDCSAYDQIAVLVESAIVCRHLGLRRKEGFFLLKAADVYEQLAQAASAYSLLCLAGMSYGLINLSHLHHIESTECSRAIQLARPTSLAQRERGQGVGRWVVLQKVVLDKLVTAAKHIYDKRVPATATTYLLRALHPWLDRQSQGSFAAELWSVTSMLPLNTAVDITGMPRLLRITPKRLTAALLPRRRTPPQLSSPSRSGGGGGGRGAGAGAAEEEEVEEEDVFLVNAAGADEKQALTMTCVAQELLEVEVYLGNPMKFELVLQRISLSTSGVAFEPHPLSLALPAECSNHRVVMSGRALAAGTLNIRGVHIRTFNLMCEHLVDQMGEGIHPVQGFEHQASDLKFSFPLDPRVPLLSEVAEKEKEKALGKATQQVDVTAISVVPQLPRLVVRFDQKGELQLFTGELRSVTAYVENVSALAADRVQLKLEEVLSALSREKQDTYYKEAGEIVERQGAPLLRCEGMKEEVALAPGESYQLQLHIHASLACCGAKLSVLYSENNASEYERECTVTMNWTVSPAITVKSLEVCPATPADITNMRAVVEDVDGEWGDTGGSTPKFQLPAMSQDECLLILEVENPAPGSFQLALCYNGERKNTSPVAERLCSKRVIFPMKRLTFGTQRDEALRQLCTPGSKPTAEQWAIYEECRAEMLSRLELSWISQDDATGVVVIPPQLVSPGRLTQLLVRPLTFRFRLTGLEGSEFQGNLSARGSQDDILSPIRRSSSGFSDISRRTTPIQRQKRGSLRNTRPNNRYPLGQFKSVFIAITNQTSVPMQLELRIQPFQEAVNGVIDTNLEHKLLWLGALTVPISEIGPQETYTHELPLCFVSLGRYHFEVCCEVKGSYTSLLWSDEMLTIDCTA